MKVGSGLRTWLAATMLVGAVWLTLAATATLQAAEGESPAATAQPLAAPKLDTGDNAWMLISSALVLMMTGPGLALFYSGLVRKKNVLGVMMQCVFLMCLMTVIWGLYGYTLGFGGDTSTPPPKWIGNSDHLFMHGVQAEWTDGKSVTPLHPQLSIPRLTHMLFQGMFFIITPALICGAFAERMKFSTMVVFMIVWGTVVYCPLCHWVWGGGILMYGSDNAGISAGGALDFAGGTVVHISSGVSALICALLLGKRLGYGSEPMPPHNLTYTAIGATMLWVGWFGFNAGSALAANELAASAFCATHFAAAAAGLTWAGMEWIFRGKPTILGTCSGVVAGLVFITPASGFVTPMSAFIMGVAVGVVCYLACTKLKSLFGYDDALDVFGVHGVGGTLGALLTGIFATRATGAFIDGKPLG
jgi:Amt family ammonium transporter